MRFLFLDDDLPGRWHARTQDLNMSLGRNQSALFSKTSCCYTSQLNVHAMTIARGCSEDTPSICSTIPLQVPETSLKGHKLSVI